MRLYLQMTVMNGYEATKAIRRSSHELAKTIPIIAMTANAFKYFFKYPLGIEINLKGSFLVAVNTSIFSTGGQFEDVLAVCFRTGNAAGIFAFDYIF